MHVCACFGRGMLDRLKTRSCPARCPKDGECDTYNIVDVGGAHPGVGYYVIMQIQGRPRCQPPSMKNPGICVIGAWNTRGGCYARYHTMRLIYPLAPTYECYSFSIFFIVLVKLSLCFLLGVLRGKSRGATAGAFSPAAYEYTIASVAIETTRHTHILHFFLLQN